MPAAEAVIAWQHIGTRALDLHAAGAGGTAGQLQVRAMLDLLGGRAAPAPQDACQDTHPDTGGDAYQDTHPARSAYQDTHPAGSAYPACTSARTQARTIAGARVRARTRTHGCGGGGGHGWAVNPVLLVPWDPSLGAPSGPAEMPGFGLVDEQDTMTLPDQPEPGVLVWGSPSGLTRTITPGSYHD